MKGGLKMGLGLRPGGWAEENRLRNSGNFIILKEGERIGAFHVLLGISQKNEGGIVP
jgi:hypothetical protein